MPTHHFQVLKKSAFVFDLKKKILNQTRPDATLVLKRLFFICFRFLSLDTVMAVILFLIAVCALARKESRSALIFGPIVKDGADLVPCSSN